MDMGFGRAALWVGSLSEAPNVERYSRSERSLSVRFRQFWPLTPALAFGAVFLLLTRFVRRGGPTASEMRLDQAIRIRGPEQLTTLSHAIDAQRWIFVVLGIALLLLVLRRPRQAIVLVFAEAVGEMLTLGLKIAINRQPPGQGPVLGWDALDVVLFPSGHVVRTTLTLGLLVLFLAWPSVAWRVPAGLVALGALALVGFTQVAVGGHLPLDVIGGYLLAAALVNVFYLLGRGPTAYKGRDETVPIRPPAVLSGSTRRA